MMHTVVDEVAYCEVRSRTESLVAPLSAEDQVVQSMPDASPAKWHRAHTTWFFEQFVLGPWAEGYLPFDADFRFLFNSYYETVGPRQPRPRRGMITRPGVEDVTRYRRAVDSVMVDLLSRTAADPERSSLVRLGLHHEEQHQELLLMDIKHLFSQSPIKPTYRAARPTSRGVTPPIGWWEHDGGLIEIGHAANGVFCFDNELPRHTSYLHPHAVADRLVSAGEWIAFIDDGGYERPELWLSDGWYAVQTEGWQSPLYWDRSDGEWSVFTLSGRRPVEPSEPVAHVSYYEADAYARWNGFRLPTEAEWEAAAATRWAPAARSEAALHPVAAGSPGADGTQLTGEVWQWTSSAYLPYPGFAPAAGAVGEYNGKFMVNQHVLRGSCCATPPGHARLTYRNFFPPSARWAFSGVRLANDG